MSGAMAHAAATNVTTSATSGEINYFFQDANGKILKVLKPLDIKKEIKKEPSDIDHSTVYAAGNVNSSVNNMGAYNQMNSNSSQFVRIQNNCNMQSNDATQYTVITPHGSASSSSNGGNGNGSSVHAQSHTAMKYESIDDYNTSHTPNLKEERYYKYKTKSKQQSNHSTPNSVQKKRKPDKAGKGLRHFSMKVCEKVKEKGTTTYNEVADELVAEEIQNNNFDTNCDQKNIRRRVYDALNVLMAIQIISKDKKEIRWIGLPSNSMEQCTTLEKENEERRARIKQKHQQLHDLLLQQVAFKSLIERNKEAERQGHIPTPNSSISLPFIIVNTHKQTKINCSVTNDKSEYIFKFDDSFEMHDDAVVLKRLGLFYGLDNGHCSYEDIERAKSFVPPNFEKYIEAYGKGKGRDCDLDDELLTYAEVNTDGMKTSDLDDEEEFLDTSDVD